MRLNILAGLATTLMFVGAAGAEAADYSGPYRHHVYSGHRHAEIGECLKTRVDAIGAPPGGSATPVISYRDGVIQEYDSGMLGQTETRPGDPMQICLVSFTRDCGNDDLPGRTYAFGNLRTGAAWTSPDIRSSCAAR